MKKKIKECSVDDLMKYAAAICQKKEQDRDNKVKYLPEVVINHWGVAISAITESGRSYRLTSFNFNDIIEINMSIKYSTVEGVN